jgi:uncharacterized membrane protein
MRRALTRIGPGLLAAGGLHLAATLGRPAIEAARLAPALVLPPLLANLAMCWVFGRTLAPGREPLLTRLCRFAHGEIPDAYARYTAALTRLWTAVFALLAVASVALALAADLAVWSWFANVGSYAILGALFLGEHVYRGIRFPETGPHSPLRTLRVMADPEAWREARSR